MVNMLQWEATKLDYDLSVKIVLLDNDMEKFIFVREDRLYTMFWFTFCQFLHDIEIIAFTHATILFINL